ncbi:MAG: hypothetical protein PSV17_09155 [Methylotenera sp.]|uniref:hypothetical protein n=1 Tax=Methylotenera sp. TaxID=2051956 RepID=UPI0024887F05|nr:hypothetical protein [Methylotenera sp.]MDI1309583.1 hypothetical protein [Methylotenera sp.]
MKTNTLSPHQLELRVCDFAQMFNSMDPSPFLVKDLDKEAETFIETWALGLSPKSKLQIIIHIEHMPTDGDPSSLLTEAIHNHFNFKAELVRREFKQLLRRGRTSLIIGMVFVSLCLVAADIIGQFGSSTALTIARESLTIIGWVAMWRPLQIFLYDWWPFVHRIRIYKMLGHAHIRALQGK